MNPETRFHSTVVALVIPIMYFSLRFLLPRLAPASTPAAVGQAALALLASLGAYKVLAQVFTVALRRIRRLKRWVLGPAYLEGTWVGYFIGDDGTLEYAVETIEQDLSSLVLKGASYSADGRLHARWETSSARVDAVKGTLSYSHVCDVMGAAVPHQGIGVFDLRRSASTAPADEIEGYSADLTSGIRAHSHERKISDRGLTKAEALPEAVRFAEERAGRERTPASR